MRFQDTRAPAPLVPSRDGVLFVSGFATSLRVNRGHLIVRSGNGRHLQEARLSKVGRPRLRRLVVYGRGGFTTWEALAWLDGVGASFVHLMPSGRIVAASGQPGADQPALRRAQVLAADSPVGQEVTRYLMGRKLRGQLENLEGHFAKERSAIKAVRAASERLGTCQTVREAMAWEAKAASTYWGAWASLPVRFARVDLAKIPEHWRTFGNRHSPLTTSPRLAATPAGAVLNYLYALAESECLLALLAYGLDPGLGWVHRDAPYRNSAALDLLEPVRPVVDRYVFNLLVERTFARRELVELPSGQVRLAHALAKSLAESTLGSWEVEAARIAEQITRFIAAEASSAVRVPSRRSRGVGRGILARRSPASSSARPRRVKGACRECGVLLEENDRARCERCLQKFEDERTDKLVSAARRVLADMRSSREDPARSPEAKAKRVATNARRREAVLEWERSNPGNHDPEFFRSEILPWLQRATLPQMMRATGLTSGYCWRIRRGDRLPHPMYWEALRSIGHKESNRPT
jgi:CRISPR-associated endonuclease Cas1